MMIHIEITHSWILWALCSILAVFAVIWLIRQVKHSFYSQRIRIILIVLRGLVLLLLLIVLADLRITRISNVRRPQQIAILWDLSFSMKKTDGSAFSPSDVLQSGFYRALRSETETEHIVNMRDPGFISEPQLKKKTLYEPLSDCGKLLRFAESQAKYSQVILITDGRSYLGEALDQIRLSKDMTVHSLGVGDTSEQKVPFLQSADIPEHISTGDTVDVVWVIHNPSGRSLRTEILIKEGDNIVAEEQIEIASRQMREFHHTYIPLDAGMKNWDWYVRDERGEHIFASRQIYVKASRIRVLCVAEPPDQDIAMVSAVLSPLQGYDLFRRDEWESLYPDENPDLVIQTWHPVLQPRYAEDIPSILFYRDPEASYISAEAYHIKHYRPYMMFNPDPAMNAMYWRQLPPILLTDVSENGALIISENENGQAFVLEYPDRQAVIISASGLWRWQIAGYQKAWNGIYRHFIEGLAEHVLQSGKQAYIDLDKDRYTGTRFIPTNYNVRLKNRDLLDLSSSKVGISILDTNYSEIRRMEKTADSPIASSFVLADSGRFFITATLISGGVEIESDTANIYIGANDLEARYAGCDVEILKKLSGTHQGQYVHMDQMDSLLNYISTEKEWKQMTRVFPARNMLILYIIMFLALCADWILRKRFGGM